MECTASFGELQPHDPVQGQGGQARGEDSSPPGCSPTRRCRRPTSCCTTPTRCRWATTSASTSSSPATSPMRFNSRYGDTFVVPEARHPAGRRPGHGPAGPDGEDVASRPTPTQGIDLRARRPGGHRAQDQAGGHRHRRRGPLRPRGQARRLQPARDPRRACTGDDRRGAGRRLHAVRPAEGRHRRGRGRAAPPAPGPLRASWSTTRPSSPRLLRQGAEQARAVASVTLRRAYDAIGLLPA